MSENPLLAQLREFVDSRDVVLFMKGTPHAPGCGFSQQAVQILAHLGVPFHGVNVLESDALRAAVKEFSDWPTIPQLYIKGEFIGGCDIMTEMFEQDELQTLLQQHGLFAEQY